MFGSGTILDVGPGADADEHRRLEVHGHTVLTCAGPARGGACPLVEEGACAIVDAADGVVFRLDLDDPYHRSMLRSYRRELGDSSPLQVVVRDGQQHRYAELLDGLSVAVEELGRIDGFSSKVAMAAAARQALADLSDPTRHSARHTLGWT